MTGARSRSKGEKRVAPSYELRPDTDAGMVLDEIVAEGCTGLHMEALDNSVYWFALYFPNGERLTWTVSIQPKRRRLRCHVGERPGGVEDQTR